MTAPQTQMKGWLGVICRPDSVYEVRQIRPGSVKREWYSGSELMTDAVLNALIGRNEAGYNIYLGVLPRAARGLSGDANTMPGGVAWVDADDTKPEQAVLIAGSKGLPKSTMVVDSGHGAHLYWQFRDQVAPGDLSELVKDLARTLGSDPAVKNPERVMRVAGTINFKGDRPVPCVLVEANDCLYDYSSLRALVPRTRVEQLKTADPSGNAAHPQRRYRLERYAQAAEGQGRGEIKRTAYLIAVKGAVDLELPDEDILRILEDWNRTNSPQARPDELEKAIRDARRYGKGEYGRDYRLVRAEANGPKSSVPTAPGDASAGRSVSSAVARLEVRYEAEQTRETTVPLPWLQVDANSRPLREGAVLVVAGAPGVGKSYLAIEMALAIHQRGLFWSYLALEENVDAWLARALAHRENDWRLVETSMASAAARASALRTNREWLCGIERHVHDSASIANASRTHDSNGVLAWLAAQVRDNRLVVIDPFAQVGFGVNDKRWAVESDFIRRAVEIAGNSRATVVVVAHTVKQTAEVRSPLALVQGAADIGRLASTVLLLEKHPERSSALITGRTVAHDVTLTIAKARFCGGTDRRFAFSFGPLGPVFVEHGLIGPKGR